MPCLPQLDHASLSTLHRQVTAIDEQPGLGWQTILSFTSVLFAGMQGTLAMESADPCRMSFEKVSLLLILEALEAAVVLAAEIYSFVELRAVLQNRLQWLYWLPYCLLMYGVISLLMDVGFTLYLANRSRVRWIPFSNIHEYRNVCTSLVTVFHLVITTCLSIILVGWRQRWWMKASPGVSSQEALEATRTESSLSVGAMCFSSVWALALLMISLVLCCTHRDKIHRFLAVLKIVKKKLKPSRSNDDPHVATQEVTVCIDNQDANYKENPNGPEKRLTEVYTRRQRKRSVRNPVAFIVRILCPNKYEPQYRREETKSMKLIKDRCRLLLLLKNQINIQKEKRGNEKTYFKVILEETCPKAHISDEQGKTHETVEEIKNYENIEQIKKIEIDDQMKTRKDGSIETTTGESDSEPNESLEKKEVLTHGDAERRENGSCEYARASKGTKVISGDNPSSLERARRGDDGAENANSSQQNDSAFANRQMCIGLIETCADLDDVVEIYCKECPLHVGNAILPDCNHDESEEQIHGNGNSAALHVVFLIATHISIFPLLFCVVCGVWRLWDRVDSETFRALKELADIVIVISIVEIALNLKHILWGRGSSKMADIPDFERVAIDAQNQSRCCSYAEGMRFGRCCFGSN